MYRFALLLLLLPAPVRAGKTFDFNSNCQLAYQEIIRLNVAAGESWLRKEKAEHPDNLIPALLDNYIDFFVLFFNEDPAEYSKRRRLMDQRLELIASGPPSSPFYLFARAVINFQWASVRLKFGYQWDGGWQMRRAFLDIRDNRTRFPDFTPNAFYDGAMKVVVSTIPDGYRWLANLFGLRSTGLDGMQELSDFLSRRDPYAMIFHDEATFHYLFLKFYISNERNDVFQYLRTQHLDTRNNHLFTYLAANLSINNQQSAAAEELIRSRNMSPGYLQTGVWDLEMGFARLNHLADDANVYLERFLAGFHGQYYVKDVLHKLSWYYYLKGDQVSAEHFSREVFTRGSSSSEADHIALKEAGGPWPDKLLLKARLLNDGGYYAEALRLLQGKSINDFDPGDRLEFLYRVGRLYDDLDRTAEAESFYRRVIASGEKRADYYAARSALQLGYMYERRGDKPTAAYWYNRCLSMKDHDYKNSLDQKAKAGLLRCAQ